MVQGKLDLSVPVWTLVRECSRVPDGDGDSQGICTQGEIVRMTLMYPIDNRWSVRQLQDVSWGTVDPHGTSNVNAEHWSQCGIACRNVEGDGVPLDPQCRNQV